MNENSKQLNQNFLSNLRLSLSVAAFSKVPMNWRLNNETPDFNRLYFIKKGEGWVKVRDKQLYPSPGQLVILPAGIPLSYSTVSKHTYTKYWCHFTATLGNVNLFQVLDLPLIIDVKDKSLIDKLFRKLIYYYKSNHLTAVLRAKSILMELICYFIENNNTDEIHLNLSSSSIIKINKVLTYIEENLSKDITVKELANLVHFHPNYFISFFRRALGSSPIHYINHLRIEKAKQMLISTDNSISEIAYAVGLELYYFSRIFKRFTGFSPTEFRNIVNKKETS